MTAEAGSYQIILALKKQAPKGMCLMGAGEVHLVTRM